MRVRINDLKRAVDAVLKQYNVEESSSMRLSLQEDNPGEGKIGDILTMHVVAIDHSNSLVIEVFGYEENRPANSVFTSKLAASTARRD